MSNINFLEPSYVKATHSHTVFGLCDGKNTQPAYTDITNQASWIAHVKNPNQRAISFIAVDHNIPILRANGDNDDRCDALLKYNEGLIFVELKNDRTGGGWIKDGIRQLASTINHFKANHSVDNYSVKKAFVANKKRPNFQFSVKDCMKTFKNQYGFNLLIQSKIDIQ